MNSLGDILGGRRAPEAPEIQIIKEFVYQKFHETPSVTIQPQTVIVHVPNAAMAGALRPHMQQLQIACKTDKRLIIRIG